MVTAIPLHRARQPTESPTWRKPNALVDAELSQQRDAGRWAAEAETADAGPLAGNRWPGPPVRGSLRSWRQLSATQYSGVNVLGPLPAPQCSTESRRVGPVTSDQVTAGVKRASTSRTKIRRPSGPGRTISNTTQSQLRPGLLRQPLPLDVADRMRSGRNAAPPTLSPQAVPWPSSTSCATHGLSSSLFAVNMLVATSAGDVYGEEDYRRWCEAAGLRELRRARAGRAGAAAAHGSEALSAQSLQAEAHDTRTGAALEDAGLRPPCRQATDS